jgi:hypothetical protein
MKKTGCFNVLVLLPLLLTLSGSIDAQTDKATFDVTASGGVSAPVIAEEEELRFWVTIQNKTDLSLAKVRLMHLPEGYQVKQLCFYAPQQGSAGTEEKKCADDAAILTDSIELPNPVLAGHSVTAAGRLAPKTAHRKETLTLVVEWTPAAKPAASSSSKNQPPATPPAPSSLTVSLGENQVQNWWEDWSGSWFYQGLKDMALPVVLLGLGTWLNLSTKRRDARSETLKQMLPVSHKYAAKYYLPLSRATERAIAALNEITAQLEPRSSPPALDPAKLLASTKKAFFYILLTGRVLDGTRRAIGGLYFKDLRGEFLAASCIKAFERLLGGDTSQLSLALQSVSSKLEKTATYETFETKFLSTSVTPTPEQLASSAAWTLFEPWIQTNDNDRRASIELLSALTIILDFEANRPYSYWYDKLEPLQVTRLDRKDTAGNAYVNVKERLLSFAQGTEKEKKAEAKKIKKYLKGGNKLLKLLRLGRSA